MFETHAYEIKLPQFEGPFDLLLFFIERDELEIQDIPIAKITNDFLDYIHSMKLLNIELASEFILVAATLMRIKAKMLLPRFEIDEEGNEIDPRADLIEQLIAYKKYKAASEDLKKMEEDRLLRETRKNITKEHEEASRSSTFADELNQLTLFKLLSTFEKILKRFDDEQNKPVHTVIQYAYTLPGQKEFLMGAILDKGQVSFANILEQCIDRYHVIFTFLAILELLQEQMMSVVIGEGFNNFWLTQHQPLENATEA